MLKLMTAIISLTLWLPSFAWALSDSYSNNLIEKSVAAIEASSNKKQKIYLAREFRQLVIKRAGQLGEASLSNKSYDAESSELVDLTVALDRANLKTGTKAECAMSLNGLLVDAGIENVEETESQSWNQLQFSLPSKITNFEFISFRILKAICE